MHLKPLGTWDRSLPEVNVRVEYNKCVPSKNGRGAERVGALCVQGEAYVALGSLDVRAVVGSELPGAGLVDPCVAANHRASTVRAVEGGIVGELIVCDRGVGSEGRHLHIADLAFGELDGLVLRLLDGFGLGRPVSPADPLDISVSLVLLLSCVIDIIIL